MLSLLVVFCIFYVSHSSTLKPLTGASSRNALLAQVNISPQLFLPIVAILTVATVGGIVVNFTPVTLRMAVPVMIVGYMYVGIGIFCTLVLQAHYLYHDLTNGFMKRTRETAADILTVGPFGQAAGALQLLGMAAQKDFGLYQRGTFLQSMAGSGVAVASTLIALVLLEFSFILACIVFCYLLENVKNWKFQLTWWTLIFPVGIFPASFTIFVNLFLISFD